MGNDLLLTRNLHVMFHLRDGPATLEELATKEKCAQGLLSIPLKVLIKSGLIIEDSGRYQLSQTDNLHKVLSVIEPWLTYKDNTYFEIAKDIAKIIHKKSWEEVAVKDVLLFGSCLRNGNIPNDIDMLIFHDAYKIREFDRSPYRTSGVVTLSDQPLSDTNQRMPARMIFYHLGYRYDPRQDADDRSDLFSLEQELQKDSAYNNIIRRLQDIAGESDPDPIIDEIFDLHAMSVKLFTDDYAKQRKQAIACCREPTFWHTVLSEGRIYDTNKQDFVIRVEDKYPGVLALFPSH